jgi:hypothetical protein
MSRRDRAAAIWALEILRGEQASRGGHGEHLARTAIRFAVLQTMAPVWSLRSAPILEAVRAAQHDTPWRLLRARAALLLRAMLRADSGDLGRQRVIGWACFHCGAFWPHTGENGRAIEGKTCGHTEDNDAAVFARVCWPLWEDARAPRAPNQNRGE